MLKSRFKLSSPASPVFVFSTVQRDKKTDISNGANNQPAIDTI